MDAPARLGDRATASRRATATRLAVAAVALLAVLLLTALEPLRVSSVSMSPTLEAGDQVIVDKVSVRCEPTDARATSSSSATPSTTSWSSNASWRWADRPWRSRTACSSSTGWRRTSRRSTVKGIDSMYFGPVTVPPDAVFVMGDNRFESIDSRTYGAIPLDELVGRVILAF